MKSRECLHCKKFFGCKIDPDGKRCLNFEDRDDKEAEVKMVGSLDFTKEIKTLKPQNDV